MYIINVLIYDMKLQLDEKVVRMKVTMILLLGTHNHYKEDLIRNAERTWHDCIHDKHWRSLYFLEYFFFGEGDGQSFNIAYKMQY